MSILDRVPVDEITERTRQIQVGRLLLSIVAGIFYGIGWLAGMLVVAVVWCAVAVKVGFVEVRGRRGSAE